MLWTRSVLFGWGRTVLLRLTGVISEPIAKDLPIWSGWIGAVAAHGLLAMVAAAVVAMGVVRVAFHRRRGGAQLASSRQMSLLASQALLGLLVVGGPNSSIPFFLWAGWLGLGFEQPPTLFEKVDDPEHEAKAQRAEIIWWASTVTTICILFTLSLGLMAPVWSRSILAGIEPEDLNDPDLGFRIQRARTLEPWNPNVELAMAAWLRGRLTQTPGWDESLFDRTCRTYREAMTLDPYDPLIAMRLAEVQTLAGRVDDALTTARRALLMNPSSRELIEWIYLYALRQNRTAIASEMIERALAAQPESPQWWRRRYEYEKAAGRGPSAGVALNVALTSALGEDSDALGGLVKASFARRELSASSGAIR